MAYIYTVWCNDWNGLEFQCTFYSTSRLCRQLFSRAVRWLHSTQRSTITHTVVCLPLFKCRKQPAKLAVGRFCLFVLFFLLSLFVIRFLVLLYSKRNSNSLPWGPADQLLCKAMSTGHGLEVTLRSFTVLQSTITHENNKCNMVTLNCTFKQLFNKLFFDPCSTSELLQFMLQFFPNNFHTVFNTMYTFSKHSTHPAYQ